MVTFVGVHGVGQQLLGRHQLVDAWGPALADGIEKAAGRAVSSVVLDMAYYGDVFPARVKPERSMKGDPTQAWTAEVEGLADLDETAQAELVAGLAEVVDAAELAAAEAAPVKAYTRMPLALQAVARALDRRFGFPSGVLCLGTLRQVRRYLREGVLKAEVDRRVTAAVDGCQVLVGHSLGSVVAYEHLRQRASAGPVVLVTLGSPLGLRMIRQWLPAPVPTGPDEGAGRPALLGGVGAWVNVHDRRDPVACAGGLARWWPGVSDVPVRNGADAHKVTSYLSQRDTGAAILAALAEAGIDGLG